MRVVGAGEAKGGQVHSGSDRIAYALVWYTSIRVSVRRSGFPPPRAPGRSEEAAEDAAEEVEDRPLDLLDRVAVLALDPDVAVPDRLL